jgi:hypothetical protein
MGGGSVVRYVLVKLVQDAQTGEWHVHHFESSLSGDGNTYDYLFWPGIYTGYLPDNIDSVIAPRSHQATLVGQYGIDLRPGGDPTKASDYIIAPIDLANPGTHLDVRYLQFTCTAFDAATGRHVLPVADQPGLYGWLEVVGPAGVGPVPINDPRHPWSLAARLLFAN